MLCILNGHSNDITVCNTGCNVLRSILEGDAIAQKRFYKLDGIKILFGVFKNHENKLIVAGPCFSAIGVACSSGGMGVVYKIHGLPEKIVEKLSANQYFSKYIFTIFRSENSLVRKAIKKKLCTNDLIPKCNDKCAYDEGRYCCKCCVQQRVFRCHTCETKEIKFYCETCWANSHMDHKYVEFFFPTRCSGMKK